MAFTTLEDRDASLLYTRLSGFITGADVARYQEELAEHGEWGPWMKIFDLTQGPELDLSTSDVMSIGRRSLEGRGNPGPGKLAILAPGDSSFGLARMYESFHNGMKLTPELGVFRTVAEVVEWLGLPEGWAPPN